MKQFVTVFFIFILTVSSCKKGEKVDGCLPEATTVRQITNKKAVVKLNGTIYGSYLIEEGSIDTKLIPCNLPMEFYQNDLQVIISGDVKQTPQDNFGPCCTQYFVISKITR